VTCLTLVKGPSNKGAPLYPSHGKAQAVCANKTQIIAKPIAKPLANAIPELKA
jgi:hypothetical protein